VIGVAATTRAIIAPKRSWSPKASSSAFFSDGKIARPPSAITKPRGKLLSNEATGPAASAIAMHSPAEIRLAQYRPWAGPASGPAMMGRPLRDTIATCPPNTALITELRPNANVVARTGTA
jgi:hypothetical protein